MNPTAELNADGSKKLSASDYDHLVRRIQDWVEFAVPAGETVLVVSRGDEDLVRLASHSAWHFPQLEDGSYAGFHPSDSDDAISRLETERAAGATYLLLPDSAAWWLDFYDDFARHLEDRYELVVSNDDCRIYRILSEGSYAEDRARGTAHVPSIGRADARVLGEFLATILPSEAKTVVLNGAAGSLPFGAEGWQPPQRSLSQSEACEREISTLAANAVEFLVVPQGAFEWSETHPTFGEALRSNHRLVTRQRYICEVYELMAAEEPAVETQSPPVATTEASQQRVSFLARLGYRSAHRHGQ